MTNRAPLHAEPPPPAVPQGCGHLRILQTTDVHAHVMPYDYIMDAPAPWGGLLAAGPVIDDLRAQAGVTMMFDCGDFLQGSPLGDSHAASGTGPNPVTSVMAGLGYDAVTLGNHDFSFGYDYLGAALAELTCPVISTNLTLPPEANLPVVSSAVIPKSVPLQGGGSAPLAVGVLGVLPPATALWEASNVAAPMGVEDILTAATREVATLRAAGAQMIVALCHSGISAHAHDDDAAVPLAQIPGVDVVLAGHIHKRFPGPDFETGSGIDVGTGRLHGVPAVMAGSYGRDIGVVDLVISPCDDAGWTVHTATSHVIPIAGRGAGAAIPAAVQSAHANSLHHMRRPIGQTDHPLTSHLSIAGPDRLSNLVAQAQVQAAQDMLGGHDALPIVSVTQLFRYGTRGPVDFVDIPVGQVQARHGFQIYPYPNRLSVLRMTGAQLRAWMEQSAAGYAHVEPGARNVPLLRRAGYLIDAFHGVDYAIDLSAPEGARIRGLTLNGAPVAEDQPVYVAVNTFRAGGAAPITAPAQGQVIAHSDRLIRDTVCRYIAAGGDVPAPSVWRFAPIPGASVVFDTAPTAMIPPGRDDLTPVCVTERGLLRMRLSL